jgi:8-hydroxy-5-deazaflavin:NADPH oxidoreductase
MPFDKSGTSAAGGDRNSGSGAYRRAVGTGANPCADGQTATETWRYRRTEGASAGRMTRCRLDRRAVSLESQNPLSTEILMRIAIIGAGNVGSALGRGWLSAGEDVVFGVPNPADPKYTSLPRERLRTPLEAARNAEAVVLATPWQATEAAVKSLGDLSGKIVIDCTNPLGVGPNGLELVLGHNTSGGEQVAAWASAAAVFKTLNQIGAESIDKAPLFPVRPVMFIAGDNESMKPSTSGGATGGAMVSMALSPQGFGRIWQSEVDPEHATARAAS